MKVLTIYDKSGPKYHRCLLPCFLMDDVELTVNHSLDESQLEGVDIVFINRIIGNQSLDNITKLRDKYGFKLVVDFDDHWKLDPDHYLYETYKVFNASLLMEYYIQEADHVTCTHERLADEISPLNPNVTVLPNAIPSFGQFLSPKTKASFTRLFWAGGVTHKKDIELVRNPVKRFSFPNIQMVMGGFVEGNPEYQVMASAFTNGARIKHRLLKSLPVEDYYYMYSECDIALIPLRATPFNSYKSNLKILEAANIAAPVIVSRVHPYLDFPEDLVNYVDKQGDWYDHVKMLLNNPDYATEQGLRLQKYCSNVYNFEAINKKRKELFHDIAGKQREAA